MTECKKTSLVVWGTAALIGLPVLYVASFGPACWWLSESSEPKWARNVLHNGRRIRDLRVQVVPPAFTPIAWAARRGPLPLFLAVRWYATLRNDFVFCGVEDWGGGRDDGMIFCP
jgi:hypothetical protein